MENLSTRGGTEPAVGTGTLHCAGDRRGPPRASDQMPLPAGATV